MATRGGTSPASSSFRDGTTPPAVAVYDARPAAMARKVAGAVESWTITEADVDAWLKRARPGDVLVYAHGPSLIQGAAAARVRALIGDEEVTPLPQRRAGDGGFDYRVARNRIRIVHERPPVCDPNMMAVLVELQNDAQSRRRCRSDAEIGAATGLTARQVKWQVEKLEAAKLIERRIVPAAGDSRFRVVRVVATGAETASPGGVR